MQVETVTQKQYLSETAKVAAERCEWMPYLQQVALHNDGTGLRFTFETEDAAQKARSAMYRLVRKHPAELFGIVIERCGLHVSVVPEAFHAKKVARMGRALRERLRTA